MMRRNIFTHRANVLPRALTAKAKQLFDDEILKLLTLLHVEMENQRQVLLRFRKNRQAEYDQGKVPQFLENHPSYLCLVSIFYFLYLFLPFQGK